MTCRKIDRNNTVVKCSSHTGIHDKEIFILWDDMHIALMSELLRPEIKRDEC